MVASNPMHCPLRLALPRTPSALRGPNRDRWRRKQRTRAPRSVCSRNARPWGPAASTSAGEHCHLSQTEAITFAHSHRVAWLHSIGVPYFSISATSAKRNAPWPRQILRMNAGSSTSRAVTMARCTLALHVMSHKELRLTTPAAARATPAGVDRSLCALSDAVGPRATRCASNGQSNACHAWRKKHCSLDGAFQHSLGASPPLMWQRGRQRERTRTLVCACAPLWARPAGGLSGSC